MPARSVIGQSFIVGGGVAMALLVFHLALNLDNPVSYFARGLYLSGSTAHPGTKPESIIYDLFIPAGIAGVWLARRVGRGHRLGPLLLAGVAINVLFFSMELVYPHVCHFDLWWMPMNGRDFAFGLVWNAAVMELVFLLGVICANQPTKQSPAERAEEP